MQFSTRLKLKNKNIEIVKSTKVLGTIISDNLKWDENSAYLINKFNKRIVLLRKVATFCNDERELTQIYITFCRVILEQSCVLWSSTLTEENKVDLERCQKVALKIIWGNKEINIKIMMML